MYVIVKVMFFITKPKAGTYFGVSRTLDKKRSWQLGKGEGWRTGRREFIGDFFFIGHHNFEDLHHYFSGRTSLCLMGGENYPFTKWNNGKQDKYEQSLSFSLR